MYAGYLFKIKLDQFIVNAPGCNETLCSNKCNDKYNKRKRVEWYNDCHAIRSNG